MIVPPGGFDTVYARAGEKSNAVVYVKNVPMAILEYANVKHPMTQYKNRKVIPPSGISIKPFLDGQSEVVRTEKDWWAFELFGNGYFLQGEIRAMKVRTGMFGDGKCHLYNVVADPSESKPLDVKYSQKLEAMIALYNGYTTKNNIIDVSATLSAFYSPSPKPATQLCR